MRINWSFIKMGVLLLVVMGLYAFSNARNSNKKVENLQIKFEGDQNLYMTHETVNKLLIHNYGDLTNLTKEHIALNNIEKAIEANEMVKKAQVFLTVNGDLVAKVTQRKPIARVEGNKKYYLDEDGKSMPFSRHHSARVPLITGEINENSLGDVYKILKYSETDEFLTKNIIGIHITGERKYLLKFRMEDFVVDLGNVEGLDKKFSNFRAFYVKAYKDKSLEDYHTVSLAFNNQVVCTKN
ncbi:cell division protein FtsQ/DivIB [Arenibacter latericius]|uniref:cell division protein FtsQ/DivIB n=1 Tax=Arenibacter latericius TaxID=86104 RepID=UPI0004127749|nr:cell division protein FtsQ/DivIB [Arenibacter latericius]MDX1363943.1 cell division protein FtsQ/DivIB [Arenibacter latericius]